MRFLYKYLRAKYRSLLEATEEAKDEVGEAKFRAKSTLVEDDGIKDLRNRIKTLVSMMKNGPYQSGGSKQNTPKKLTTPNKFQKKFQDNGQGSPKESNRPATSSAGPFKPGQKPYQCYKCGGGDTVLGIALPPST